MGPPRWRRRGAGRGRRREPRAGSGRRRRGSGVGRRLPRAAVGGLFRGEEPGLGRLRPRRRLPFPAPPSACSPRARASALPSPSRAEMSPLLPRPAPPSGALRSSPPRPAHPAFPRAPGTPPGNRAACPSPSTHPQPTPRIPTKKNWRSWGPRDKLRTQTAPGLPHSLAP